MRCLVLDVIGDFDDQNVTMEFFAKANISASAAELQRRLTISELPRWCASVEKVLGDAGTSDEIFCVWGTFRIHREILQNGVRFTLPDCPYALQWTVTTGNLPDPERTVIHLTTNRHDHDQEFLDTLRQFVDNWKTGLEKHRSS
jgi:hypothetical protein